MAFSWIAATPVARQLGIPIVWRAGGTEGGAFERLALRAWAALNPPDLLVCCGEGVRRMFASLIPAPAIVVPNGVDTERFHPNVAAPPWYRPPGDEGRDRLRRPAGAAEAAGGHHPRRRADRARPSRTRRS